VRVSGDPKQRDFAPSGELGLGLRLSIVEQLAELHGGAMHTQSPGGGSATFTVMLPRARGGGAE
jgi:signal transduction histidine kinase